MQIAISATFDWNESALSRLRALIKAGHSNSAIAEIFAREYNRPFTRNQIIGAASRYALSGLAGVFKPKSGPKPAAIKKRVPSAPRLLKADTTQYMTPKRKHVATVSTASKIRSPIVHDYAKCKWIDGDPKYGPSSVCGQPAAVNLQGNPKPYCPHHCSIAYVMPRERQKEEANG